MQSWKFLKIEKILAGAPEPQRGERENQNFTVFYFRNFALKDFLIQLYNETVHFQTRP